MCDFPGNEADPFDVRMQISHPPLKSGLTNGRRGRNHSSSDSVLLPSELVGGWASGVCIERSENVSDMALSTDFDQTR